MATIGRTAPLGFLASDSPTETARFQRRVRRYELVGPNPTPLLDAIVADDPDLAIVRIPTDRGEVFPKLAALGDELILGDCLVIYARDNSRLGAVDPLKNALHARYATESDAPQLDRMTRIIFEGYRNHYSVNPRLEGFDLIDGYQEWTRSFIGTGERRCLLLEIDHELCGFATVRFSTDETEGVLYGVMPKYQGRGVYRDIIRATVSRFIAAGSPRTIVSTQIDNRAVQKVWASEGFAVAGSQYTLHLNRHVNG